MNCRICQKPIVFIRGRFPHRNKTTTLAAHVGEAQELLQYAGSKYSQQHPGAQRKLRQALEAEHDVEVLKRNTNLNSEPVGAAV